MKILIFSISLFVASSSAFSIEISKGGSLKFRGNSGLVAESPGKSFVKYGFIDFMGNPEDSNDLWLGLAIVNSKVEAGLKVNLPDTPKELESFLRKTAGDTSVLCKNKKAMAEFIDMSKTAFRRGGSDEFNGTTSYPLFSGPEIKSGVARQPLVSDTSFDLFFADLLFQ